MICAATLAGAMLFCSCGGNPAEQSAATVMTAGETDKSETVSVDAKASEPETEAVTEMEKATGNDDSSADTQMTEAEEPEEQSIDGKTYDDWKMAYSNIVHRITEGGSFLDAFIDTYYADLVGFEWEPTFSLQDLNQDGIPELFLAVDSMGNIQIYAFDSETGMVNDTGVDCGYRTSGSVRVRALKGSDCFVTGPAFANETILYRIQNGEAEQLLGFGNGTGYQFFTDDYNNEISEEELRNLFKEYTGLAWNADFRAEFPDDLGLSEYLSEDYADVKQYDPLEKIDEAISEYKI